MNPYFNITLYPADNKSWRRDISVFLGVYHSIVLAQGNDSLR